MLAAPILTLAWFVAAAPGDAGRSTLLTYLVAAILAAGGAATGATQQGAARAATATLGAALFAALGVVILGVVMAGERQVGVASPTLAHAFAAAVGGLGGAVAAAAIAAVVARLRSRWVRLLAPASPAMAVAVGLVGVVLPARLTGAPASRVQAAGCLRDSRSASPPTVRAMPSAMIPTAATRRNASPPKAVANAT